MSLQKEACTTIVSHLWGLGEFFGAGFYEEPGAPPVVRIARGIRRQLENVTLPAWTGDELYPSGQWVIFDTSHGIIQFHYALSLVYNKEALNKVYGTIKDDEVRTTLETIHKDLSSYYRVGSCFDSDLTLGGGGFTHSIPNTGRILREGLSTYAERIASKLKVAIETGGDLCFYMALQDVVVGIRAFHSQLIANVKEASGVDAGKRELLLTALQQVPFGPARNFYEATVATNVVFYLDGCDSLGRVDRDLGDYYERDLADGRIDYRQALCLVRLLWRNIDSTRSWNVVLGGSDGDGRAFYNGLTLICLEAARKMRRPNLAMRIRRDMPDELFEAVLDTLETGCGLPALYNEEAYLEALRDAHLNIDYRDINDYAFGGCTETMIHGKSNVGSLDAGINMLEILVRTLKRCFCTPDLSFDRLIAEYKTDVQEVAKRVVECVNFDQEMKAKFQPQPVRSLLIDDCIDSGIEYNAGGARYNWSIINIGGLGNVADSLAAIRELIYEKGEISPESYWKALRANFVGSELLRQRIALCPHYGNDKEVVDLLTQELSSFVFIEFRKYAPWRGGRFLPGCLMFVTYAHADIGEFCRFEQPNNPLRRR